MTLTTNRTSRAVLLLGVLAACGGAGDETREEPGESRRVSDDEVPDPGVAPSRPSDRELENVEALPASFCSAYDTLRDAERLLSFGEGSVSTGQVDAVVASLRTMSPEAPAMLSAALDASARIYEEERSRIAGDEIADILLERRTFDDERDLLLQLNIRQDYIAHACPDLDGTGEDSE